MNTDKNLFNDDDDDDDDKKDKEEGECPGRWSLTLHLTAPCKGS